MGGPLVCLSMCVCVYPSVCMSVYLPVCQSICLCVPCVSVFNLSCILCVPCVLCISIPQGEGIDLSGVDVWADSFDPSTVFDKESLKEITDFFLKNAGDLEGQIRSVVHFRRAVNISL